MQIAIIGGGFTGLAAGYELSKAGHHVTIFEKDNVLGGLAHGYKEPHWEWSLEKAYHHLFTNDDAIIRLIKELGLSDKLIIKRPVTANYISSSQWTRMTVLRSTETLPWKFLTVIKSLIGKVSLSEEGKTLQGHDGGSRASPKNASPEHPSILPFDSPANLLTFPGLPMIDKLRTGVFLAVLKLTPWWKPFENITAEQLFVSIGGKKSWETIWKPLMIGKFGDYADSVAASWLWARIKKRTPSLCYIEGGFHTLVAALERSIRNHGGTIVTNTSISRIRRRNFQFSIFNFQFDKVLLTIPTPIANKLVPHLTFDIGNLALTIPHLHAQTLILETNKPILKDVYWLNILDRTFPFLAVVTHTNFMDPKHYGGHHLTYFGNYLPEGHKYLSMTKEQLLKEFTPFIKRLNPLFGQLSIVNCQLFTGWYAQPVHQLHYSQKIPPINTPIPGIYLANMDFIYPWDRGTNYAVDLGRKAAQVIIQSDQ